jgi:hypothetical protein
MQNVREFIPFAEKLESKKRKTLRLRSSHGKGNKPMFQENLGTKFDRCSIFN